MLTSKQTYRALIAVFVVFALVPGTSTGLNNQPHVTTTTFCDLRVDPDCPLGVVIDPLDCPEAVTERVGVTGTPLIEGLALPGFRVRVVADHLNLTFVGSGCDFSRRPIGDRFRWRLSGRPAGSQAVLDDADTLSPELLIDEAGTFEITLTACPDGCTFAGRTYAAHDLALRIDSTSHLPPETRPAMPPSAREPSRCDLLTNTCGGSSMSCRNDDQCTAAGQPEFAQDLVDIKCQFGGSVVDPQWVTVERWDGVPGYAGYHAGEVNAVEGAVYKARISSVDNEFNHHSIDANWNVVLDGDYRHLDKNGDGKMHNEWETGVLDVGFQPSLGDRVSMWGYLIHDCGHGPYNTEIHPPVGIASHRERAVRIPEGRVFARLPDDDGNPSTVGSDVYVPGIITDLWFNRDAGEMIEGDWTALHQPASFVPANCSPGAGCVTFRGETGRVAGGDPIQGLSPILGVFTFRILLPRSPRAVLEAAGVDGLPDIPLYAEVVAGNIDPRLVTLEPETEPGDDGIEVSWLRGRVDLSRAAPGNTPWLRIASAWVYPDPDNWGLKRMGVSIDKLHVTNDGDGIARGKGDWRLWVQLNNAAVDARRLPGGLPRQEWTRIVDYKVEDDCGVFGGCGRDETFGDRPWSTENPALDRDLGPHLLVFPGQGVHLHASGFEEDWFGGDSLGVIDLFSYAPGRWVLPNICSSGGIIADASPTEPGCANYSLHYELRDLGPLDGAELSAAARALHDAYALIRERCPPGGGDDVFVCEREVVVDPGVLQPPLAPPVVHPLEELLPLDGLPVALDRTPVFERQETEENIYNNMSIGRVRAELADLYRSDPETAEAFMAKMRTTFDSSRERLGDELLLDLKLLEMAAPRRLYRRHFGDVAEPEVPADASRRYIRGAGRVGRGKARTHVLLRLNCYPFREPNRLRVHWRRHRFQLDLMYQVACEGEDQPMRTHSGRGVGRLDGKPDYVAEWTFTDTGRGKRNRDTVQLRILDPEGALVREVIGVLRGQLHAGELRSPGAHGRHDRKPDKAAGATRKAEVKFGSGNPGKTGKPVGGNSKGKHRHRRR